MPCSAVCWVGKVREDSGGFVIIGTDGHPAPTRGDLARAPAILGRRMGRRRRRRLLAGQPLVEWVARNLETPGNDERAKVLREVGQQNRHVRAAGQRVGMVTGMVTESRQQDGTTRDGRRL